MINIFNRIKELLAVYRIKLMGILILTILVVSLLSILSYKVYQFILEVPVKEIEIVGASYEVEKIINDNLRVLYQNPILDLNLENISKAISSQVWVNVASIHRNLSGKVTIFIVEKNPYFLWKDDNENYNIINSNNNVVNIKLNYSLDHLIVIEKGQEALDNADKIKFLLYKDFEILKRIKKLVFHGYRWDIYLKNGIIIKLPENNMDKAYDMVIKVNKDTDILNKQINYIDATSENKLFISPKDSKKK